MKKLFVWALAAIALSACDSEPKFKVEGEVAGADGKTLYLEASALEGIVPMDSVKLAGSGTFSFKGNQALPIFAAIETESGPLLRFFLENSPITIHGSANDPEAINVLGSTSESLYRAYLTEIDSAKKVIYADSAALATAS